MYVWQRSHLVNPHHLIKLILIIAINNSRHSHCFVIGSEAQSMLLLKSLDEHRDCLLLATNAHYYNLIL